MTWTWARAGFVRELRGAPGVPEFLVVALEDLCLARGVGIVFNRPVVGEYWQLSRRCLTRYVAVLVERRGTVHNSAVRYTVH